ncbi:FAST kinase domain-containing protein 5, mitochondrial [Anabarilius grahami]|uniref:FAST kinase domain-containing protein 5, mitochondrial n=1 Tax=Anabarilius grahami TaxID=495550 RepID=A0A3N0Z6B0_ANAGA|nr:FAST kinase domain-containing protein 5, mitochondrial [Anabarilius grahami]
MGDSNDEMAHQPSRNDGCNFGLQGVHVGTQKPSCPGPLGQRDGGCLHKPPRRSQVLPSKQIGEPSSAMNTDEPPLSEGSLNEGADMLSQITLSDRATCLLVDKTLTVVKDMSDFGIANVMKYMQLSYLDHLPCLGAMGLEVPRWAPRMEVQGLMHIILVKQLPNVVSRCRSKDVAKKLWAFGMLCVLPNQCPKLYPCLTAILRELQYEFQRFPEHLLTGLLSLAFAGLFPQDLLSLALSRRAAALGMVSLAATLPCRETRLSALQDIQLIEKTD